MMCTSLLICLQRGAFALSPSSFQSHWRGTLQMLCTLLHFLHARSSALITLSKHFEAISNGAATAVEQTAGEVLLPLFRTPCRKVPSSVAKGPPHGSLGPARVLSGRLKQTGTSLHMGVRKKEKSHSSSPS